MRVLIQRVARASVTVGDEVVGEIGPGLLLLVGVTHDDRPDDAEFMAAKVANLRIFEDDAGHMNRSALDLHDALDASVGVLVVSQFTLYADVRRGRRPSFVDAAPAALAAPLVASLANSLRAFGLPTAEGRFGAEMAVTLVNDGPVTILLDSADLRRSS
jgi:D-tyrosyl-tRNA(Tyr) deacylase